MTIQCVDDFARVLTVGESFVARVWGQPSFCKSAYATYKPLVKFPLASLGELIFSDLFTLGIDGVSNTAFLFGALCG